MLLTACSGTDGSAEGTSSENEQSESSPSESTSPENGDRDNAAPEDQEREQAQTAREEESGSTHSEQAADSEQTNDNAATFPADDAATPTAPQVGQWVRYGVRWRNGGRSTTRYAIVDREAGGWWIEIEDRRRQTLRQVRMHLRVNDAGEMEILALLFTRDGRRQRIPPRLLPTYRPMLEQWLGLMLPTEIEGDVEDAQVRAGTFQGCRRELHAIALGPQQTDAVIWRHGRIPVTGIVKLEDQAGTHQMELLDFGLEGARSTFR